MSTPASSISSSTALCRADRIGFAASFLCALHCALLPVLLALMPLLGTKLAGMEGIDTVFVAFVSVLGITTMTLGWRRHREWPAVLLLLAGLALLWTDSVTHLHEHTILHAVVMTLGGLSVAAAHFLNLRLTHAHSASCCCHQAEADDGQVPAGMAAEPVAGK